MYAVDNLGGLGGATSVAFQINNQGEAVGWAQTLNGDTHAFSALAGSTLQDLSPASASDNYAYGVNNKGQIAGTTYVAGQPNGTILTQSNVIDLGAGSFALSINDSGQVAGGNGHAEVYANGGATDLGTLTGGTWSAAYDINNSGTVAGTSDTASGAFRGFVWSAATGMTALGTFGGMNSYAMGINDAGAVTGFASLASGYEHAFIDTGGNLTDLGTLGGGSSFAYGINDSDSVVGYSWLPDGTDHAFVWIDGTMFDLNSLIPSDSGWVLSQAFGINDAGQIVGTGIFDGQSEAFRLDPISYSPNFLLSADVVSASVPEPAPAGLLAIGIVLLAISGAIRTRSAPRQ